MRTVKSWLPLFSVFVVSISSCSSNTPVITEAVPTSIPEIKAPTATFTLTSQPTVTPTIAATKTLLPSNEPGLMVTLGEKVESPWYPGIPVFSPDGKIIALASSKIRFWDVYSHELIRELENPYPEGCYVSNALFSPDGSLFAVSITGCWIDATSTGHLFVWDVNSGNLLQDWAQKYAHMPPSSTTSWDYNIPVSAMAFLPNSTKIVFANGNTLEIRDALQDVEPVVIDLGMDLFASQISLPSDGRFVYVLMIWEKDHDFPALWTHQKKLQIWDMNTHSMRREINYSDGWVNIGLGLHNSLLFQVEYEKGKSQLFDLETDKTKDLPYRTGWTYFSSDMSFMVYARLFGVDDKEKVIEVWNTDTWRNIYSFLPDFGKDWTYGMHEIVFSPDNTMLAIEHQEQVTLWNIQQVTTP